MDRDLDPIWISVDYRPPDGFGRSFTLGLGLRTSLREAGLPSSLFSVHDDLAGLLAGGKGIVFPIEERYPQLGFESEMAGLRQALEQVGARFVGSGSRAVLRAYDKEESKRVLAAGGLAVPGGICLRDAASVPLQVESFLDRFGCPAIVKPALGWGGSQGVELVRNEAELRQRVSRWVQTPSPPLLLEEFVAGEEVTAWVMGIEPQVRCLNVLTIDKHGKPIFDQALKTYSPPKAPGLPPPDLRHLCGIEVSEVGATAVAAHRLLGAHSYSRVDLILRDGRAVVLELNACPILNDDPELGIAVDTGLSFGELMAGLVEHARTYGRASRA